MEDNGGELSEEEILVYLDYKWKLSVAQIVVNIPLRYRINTLFKVCTGGLEVRHGTSHTKIDFRGLKLVPPSCHNMQWTRPGELQMRIQAYKQDHGGKKTSFSSTGTSPSSSSENDGEGLTKFNMKLELTCPIDKDSDMSMLCCMCGELIVKSQRFSRILPLPTDNWQDLTDSWFCCQHNHRPDGNSSHHPLVPRPGDCLYSDLSIVLHGSALCTSGISTNKSGMVNCTRCRNILGQRKKQESMTSDSYHIVLFRHQIMIRKSPVVNPLVDRLVWLHDFELGIANMLLRQAEEHNCFRSVIEAGSAKQASPFLLIWLMDPSSVRYHGAVNTGHKEVLNPECVAKVIYKDCIKDTELAIQWRKDLGAHSVLLPEMQCIQLLQLLTKRSETIPPSLRLANDFLVSYFETNLPCPL